MTAPLLFDVLGPLRVRRGDAEVDLGPAKHRAVLAMLVLHANKPVSPAAIVDAVWSGDPPADGTNVVQKYVAGLRRILGREAITLSEAGYALRIGDDCLDADVFQHLLQRAEAARAGGRLAEAESLLGRANAMWRADALAGLSGPFFDAMRDRLAESRGAGLEAWAHIQLQLGRHAQLVPQLVDLVARFPLREGLRYTLILALYRCGRQAEALAAYRDTRTLLIEEYGVEPGERLQDLHRRILQGDPSLLPPHGYAVTVIPAPRSRPAPASRRRLVLAIVGAAVPVVSCGFGTWAVIGFFAAYRRSWKLALGAAGYLALNVFFAVSMGATDPELGNPPWDDLAMIALAAALFGGAAHGALLGLELPRWQPGEAAVSEIEARVRREQARQLHTSHPKLARELGIGRPDRERAFDDGGLVDVNAVPAGVLTAVAGLPPGAAAAIAADRDRNGPLATVDDLVRRGLLSGADLDRVRDRLIV